jgi:hypothetical protein
MFYYLYVLLMYNMFYTDFIQLPWFRRSWQVNLLISSVIMTLVIISLHSSYSLLIQILKYLPGSLFINTVTRLHTMWNALNVNQLYHSTLNHNVPPTSWKSQLTFHKRNSLWNMKAWKPFGRSTSERTVFWVSCNLLTVLLNILIKYRISMRG